MISLHSCQSDSDYQVLHCGLLSIWCPILCKAIDIDLSSFFNLEPSNVTCTVVEDSVLSPVWVFLVWFYLAFCLFICLFGVLVFAFVLFWFGFLLLWQKVGIIGV